MVDKEIAAKASSTALLAVAAAAAGSSAASAADMAVKVPAPPPPPLATWQGFYLGGSVGASWLHSVQDDTAAIPFIYESLLGPFTSFSSGGSTSTANAPGFIGGVELGYNFQFGKVVAGVEADFSWLGSNKATSNGAFNNTTIFIPSGGNYTYTGSTTRSSRVDDLALFRARFGYDFNGTLPYLTVGAALGNISNSFTANANGYRTSQSATISSRSWVPGVVLGGGVEQMLTGNWSLKAEILWVGFADSTLGNPFPARGSGSYTFASAGSGPIRFSNELLIGQVGLNYRF